MLNVPTVNEKSPTPQSADEPALVQTITETKKPIAASILERTKNGLMNSYSKNTNENSRIGYVTKRNTLKGFWRGGSEKTTKTAVVTSTKYGNSESAPADPMLQITKALEAQDVEFLLELLGTSPRVASSTDINDRLPLHAICATSFVDDAASLARLISAAMHAFPESVGYMDKDGKTALHLLCVNPTVTTKAITLIVNCLDAVIAMPDKDSALPLHHICLNRNVDIDIIKPLLSNHTASRKDKNNSTALHNICRNEHLSIDVLQLILAAFPGAAAGRAEDKRTPLHVLCANPSATLEMILCLLDEYPEAAALRDEHGCTPLHIICENSSVSERKLSCLLMANPNAAMCAENGGYFPLHNLCSNSMVTALMIQTLIDVEPKSAQVIDKQNSTPLHLLCMISAMNTDMVHLLLEAYPQAARMRDIYDATPLHYACSSSSINADIIWLFVEQDDDNRSILGAVDLEGKTCLHRLCENTAITMDMLNILFEAYPSAAQIMDMHMRLAIQYLLENDGKTENMLCILISNQSLYRLRYRMLQKKFTTLDSSHVLTDCALDVTSSNTVTLNYYLHKDKRDHDMAMMRRTNQQKSEYAHSTFYVKLVEHFDDANRRVSALVDENKKLENNSSAKRCKTLNYAIVLEAPEEILSNELGEYQKRLPLALAKKIIAGIGRSLAHWHLNVQLMNGMVSTKTIGRFLDGSYRLLEHSFAHEIGETVTRSPSQLCYCPPEIGKIGLKTGRIEYAAHPAIDMWQYGCTIYEIVKGRSLVKDIVPWIELVDQEQMFHILCGLNDRVILKHLDGIDEEIHDLLTKLLVIDPRKRWTMDRILGISGYAFMKKNYDNGRIEYELSQERNSQVETEDIDNQVSSSYEDEANLCHIQEVIKLQQALAEERNQASERLELSSKQIECVYEQRKEIVNLLEQASKQIQVLTKERVVLKDQLDEMITRLSTVLQQKEEIRIQYKMEEKKGVSLRDQLDTTVRMLIYILPLARKVYGAAAEDFLANTMSNAAHFTASSFHDPADHHSRHRCFTRERLRQQLKNSILAHGCIATWANQVPPEALAATDEETDNQADNNVIQASTNSVM